MKPNKKFPRISMKWRFILLPIFFIWWCFQFACFSCFGGIFCIIFGIVGLISELGNIEKDFEDSLFLMALPFICPVIWWIRYFKFGEYNTLE